MIRTVPGAKEWFYCATCDESFLFQGSEAQGAKDDDEEIRCLSCHAVLGRLRCDAGPPSLMGRAKGRKDFAT